MHHLAGAAGSGHGRTRSAAPKIAPAAWLKAGKFDQPVGSGPYVLDAAKSTTGSVYSFTKNPNHWDTANYPYKKLAVKVITSETAAVSALKTGQIDAILVAADLGERGEGVRHGRHRLPGPDHAADPLRPDGQGREAAR